MKKITVYSKNNCPRCATVKAFLNSQNIAYTERNIEEDSEAKTFLINEGLLTLPSIQLDDNVPFQFTTIPELAEKIK